MDFAYDARTEQLRAELLAFMDEHVHPSEAQFERTDPEQPFSWERPEIMAGLRAEARRRGLWNLFLPDAGPHASGHGAGLTNVQYAPLAEITGRSPHVAPEALNCNAPDTGNMELLHLHGTPEQQERWLVPLLEARIRSGFCMTEPDVASSDASNIALRMTPTSDGGFVLDGRKWWTTGALSRDVAVLVVMGVSEPDAPRRERHTMLLVPRDTPGVQVKRGLSVFGFWDETHGGHGEVVFDGVRVGPEALLGERGRGFALAQARLGPGRIHHCMRLIGMAERAFDLMCRRVLDRVAFGRPLAEQGVVQQTIADCRIRLEQLRLQVLRCAWLIDTVGAKGAASEISAIKIAAPATAQWVIDKAIEVHGAAGVSADYPLAMLWAQARGLRFADGPDEVHRMVLARRELARYR
jgi:acyl-CoA dehydrogenase